MDSNGRGVRCRYVDDIPLFGVPAALRYIVILDLHGMERSSLACGNGCARIYTHPL